MSDIEKSIKEINSFGENLLDSSLAKYSSTVTTQAQASYNPHRHGCPVDFSFSVDPLSTKFYPHYDLKLVFHSYDFVFEQLNYENEDVYKQAKTVRGYPHHLRSTLFIANDKLKELRRKDFMTVFMVGEELKDKANKLYKEDKFYDALSMYNLIYSFYKWIEFKDKKRRDEIFNHITEIGKHPIVDDDVVIKTIKLNKKMQNEINSFNSALTFLLKAMCYCYIHLRAYSEAVKCIDEAFEYADDSLPDLYYRRAQARMYNKFSSIEDLRKAEKDLKAAKQRKKGEQTIEDEYKKLIDMIKQKEEKEITRIKSKFLYL